MDIDDITSLESVLGVSLPQEYVEFVCCEANRREFERSVGIPMGLLFDRDQLEMENQSWRETSIVSDYWKPSWLSICPDGSGGTYFITTEPFDGKIYDFDHEQTQPGYDPTTRSAFESLADLMEFERGCDTATSQLGIWERAKRFFAKA